MAGRTKPGIFVLEARWSSRVTDVRTVDPVLQALAQAGVAKHVKHVINDPEDFVAQLRRWGQRQHDAYNIGYVAMHGSEAAVHVGRRTIDLLDAAGQLPARALGSRILHFGSCSVLRNVEDQQPLRKSLGVRAITGFTTDVDWFESLAFELILFEVLTYYKRLDAAEKYIRKQHGQFADRLGFVMVR